MITFEKETEAKSYTELFTHRSSFRRLLLAVSIQASVQMTGVSAIQYYSPTIFAQIGIPGSETLKYQGISSIIAIIAQFCCILFIDYTGRRWAMIGGNLVSFFLSFPFPQLSTFHTSGKKNIQLILPFFFPSSREIASPSSSPPSSSPNSPRENPTTKPPPGASSSSRGSTTSPSAPLTAPYPGSSRPKFSTRAHAPKESVSQP